MTEATIDLADENVMKAIEFQVMSRWDTEKAECCTIVANQEVIDAIKISIARQLIFQGVYNKLIFQVAPNASSNEIIVIPDDLIEAAVDDQISDTMNNPEIQKKAKELNDLMESIEPEVLNKIADENAELTDEEKALKEKIQNLMIALQTPLSKQLQAKDYTEKVLQNVAGNATFLQAGGTNE